MAAEYNTELFEAAHERFLNDPKTLTDVDLGQLEAVNQTLAERARARRAGYVQDDSNEDLKKLSKQAVTHGFLLKFFQDCISPLLGTYRLRIRQSHEKIAALEARLATLESQPGGIDYKGVWRDGQYLRNAAVTHQGSIWIARSATTARPGTEEGAASWTLAVKKGSDGRDGKDAGR